MNRSPLARLTLVLAFVSLFGLAAAQSPCAPGGEQTAGSTGLVNGLLHVGAVLRDVQEALCRLYVLTDHERELPRFCPRLPGVCELLIEPGPCRAAIPRWYFDAGKGQCAEFIYGGCQGNENNFTSEDACRKECGGEPIPVCQLLADTGPCTAAFRRWHFDTKSGECSPFVYGGCGGNANNFETREACEKGCSVPDVCSLGADPGPCKAAIPRWFHDPRTNRCELFTWGGCGGNANQFVSLAECEQACPSCREGLCLPHQECRLYKEPACLPGASCAPEAYCADTCERFPCPLGQVCVLQQVQCVRAPCPPIAQCVPHDPCATVRCMAPMACQVDVSTGQPYCAVPAP